MYEEKHWMMAMNSVGHLVLGWGEKKSYTVIYCNTPGYMLKKKTLDSNDHLYTASPVSERIKETHDVTLAEKPTLLN